MNLIDKQYFRFESLMTHPLPHIRSVQKCFLQAFQKNRDSDEALTAANIDRKVMESWLISDAVFLRTIGYISRYPEASLEGTDYQDYSARPAERRIDPSVLKSKDRADFFAALETSPMAPTSRRKYGAESSPADPLRAIIMVSSPANAPVAAPAPQANASAFDDPNTSYHMISGKTLAERHMRQAIYLNTYEHDGRKDIALSRELIGTNKSIPRRWLHEGHQSYTPEFVEALALLNSGKANTDWRTIPAYTQAIESLEAIYASKILSRRDAGEKSAYESWQDIYQNHHSVTLERQAVFLLALEEAGGDLKKASGFFGQSDINSKYWRRNSEVFSSAVDEIVSGKGPSVGWKNRAPYGEVLDRLQQEKGLILFSPDTFKPVDNFFNVESPTSIRKTIFLSALERELLTSGKQKGSLTPAASKAGVCADTVLAWRHDSDDFNNCVRDIMNSKGTDTHWKTQEPYAQILSRLESGELQPAKPYARKNWAQVITAQKTSQSRGKERE